MDVDEESIFQGDLDEIDRALEDIVPTITKETVVREYRTVWKEFYDWEQSECLYSIKAIIFEDEEDLGNEPYQGRARTSDYEFTSPEASASNDTLYDTMKITIYDQRNGRKCRTHNVDIFVAQKLDPFSSYESCTPSTVSIAARWYSIYEDETLSFVPFADDPTFDFHAYSLYFKFLGWLNHEMEKGSKVDDRDPDLEQIHAETFRRLFKLLPERGPSSFKVIDDASKGIIESSRDDESQGGLLCLPFQRDPLPWVFRHRLDKDEENWVGARSPDRTKEEISLEQIYPSCFLPGASDVGERVQRHRSLLCKHMNCLQPICRTHGLRKRDDGPPSTVYPKITSENLRESDIRPCGSLCFLKSDDDDGQISVSWDNSSVDILREVLTFMPDELPCKLTRVVRKPCREIFAQRKKIVPDESVETEVVDDDGQPLIMTLKFKLNINKDLVSLPSEPCVHHGPCSLSTKCDCWFEKRHCQRLCVCPPSCQQRWKGCSCKPKGGGRPCQSEKCPCFKIKRECDPELCKGCECTGPYTRNSCRNSQMQRGLCKRIAIKESRWGMGAYLMERARKGDLLGEYVGDIVSSDAALRREIVGRHKGRNYAFSLPDDSNSERPNEDADVLDAIGVSNETRFPNHGNTERVRNCSAYVYLIDNQCRIGLYAERDIKPKEELLFDYGADFFKYTGLP